MRTIPVVLLLLACVTWLSYEAVQSDRRFELGHNLYIYDRKFDPFGNDKGIRVIGDLVEDKTGILRIYPKIKDKSRPLTSGIEINIFPGDVSSQKSGEYRLEDVHSLTFDKDGLAKAPPPLADGYFVGDPKKHKAPGGSPIVIDCEDRIAQSKRYSVICNISYKLNNYDILSYNFRESDNTQPISWIKIDQAVRGFVECSIAPKEKPAIVQPECAIY